MTDRPLDPNDAPEGYVAEAMDGLPACDGCCFARAHNECTLHSTCGLDAPKCTDRPDGHRVRYVKRRHDSAAALLKEAVGHLREYVAMDEVALGYGAGIDGITREQAKLFLSRYDAR